MGTGIADLLSDLQSSGYELGVTGFDVAETDELFPKVHDKDVRDDAFDVAQAVSVSIFVEKGDVWLMGCHRLKCGDSTIPGDVAVLMDALTANL